VSRILVVEDEKNLRALYEEELSAEGYEVVVAGSGEEALEILETSRPDLVVLDIRMPGMDGIEALGRILGKDRSIPVVINTAYSSYKNNFMTWAANAYVVKSSDLSELKATIRKLLQDLGGR
jgi:two-component system response regulator (stage 0 sporulation protein F)